MFVDVESDLYYIAHHFQEKKKYYYICFPKAEIAKETIKTLQESWKADKFKMEDDRIEHFVNFKYDCSMRFVRMKTGQRFFIHDILTGKWYHFTFDMEVMASLAQDHLNNSANILGSEFVEMKEQVKRDSSRV